MIFLPHLFVCRYTGDWDLELWDLVTLDLGGWPELTNRPDFEFGPEPDPVSGENRIQTRIIAVTRFYPSYALPHIRRRGWPFPIRCLLSSHEVGFHIVRDASYKFLYQDHLPQYFSPSSIYWNISPSVSRILLMSTYLVFGLHNFFCRYSSGASSYDLRIADRRMPYSAQSVTETTVYASWDLPFNAVSSNMDHFYGTR